VRWGDERGNDVIRDASTAFGSHYFATQRGE
jgi:hypothetical protein